MPNHVESIVSILSLVLASASFAISIFSYNLSRSEIENIKLQIRSAANFELKKSIDNINEKFVDWDIDLPLMPGITIPNDQATYKKIAMLLHCTNTYHYMTTQRQAFDDVTYRLIADWFGQMVTMWSADNDIARVVKHIAESAPSENKDFKEWINAIADRLPKEQMA